MAYAAGGNARTKQAAITAENLFTSWVTIDNRRSPNGFTASVIDNGSTLSVTWTVQARRVLNDGTSGNPVDIYTSSALSGGGVQTAQLAGVWQVRVGVKTGNYTAGAGVAALDW